MSPMPLAMRSAWGPRPATLPSAARLGDRYAPPPSLPPLAARARGRRGPPPPAAPSPSPFLLSELAAECAGALAAVEALGPVPRAVALAWGAATVSRHAEARLPVLLSGSSNSTSSTSSGSSSSSSMVGGGGGGGGCWLTLVGVLHREAIAVGMVAEALGAAGPGGGAGAGAAPEAVALEARAAFLPLYGRLAGAVPAELRRRLQAAPLRDLQETFDYVSLDDRLAWHGALVDACAAISSSPEPLTSALDASNLLRAFLARELALSEKLAAAWAAEELGVPLHGMELDSPAAYGALLAGPLTGGESYGRGGGGGGRPAAPGITMDELEAEQRRMALAVLPPDVAAAFVEWIGAVPPDDLNELLQLQLAALMQECMEPTAFLAYTDATTALWSDEARVGPAIAAQNRLLTVGRERHFLQVLRRLAAGGGRGGAPCGRVAVVLGRAHAARLRRELQQQAPE